MTRSIAPGRWISCALALLFLGNPFDAYANLKPPRVSFTLEQAARQTIAQYDLIVEAEVGATSTDTLDYAGQCHQVGALTLLSIRSIWGTVTDPTIKVRSWTTPNEVDRADECQSRRLGRSPLPEIGAKGIFLLVCEPHDTRMIPGNVPTLCNPDIDFLKKDEQGFVTQTVRGHPFQWAYSDLVSELVRQARATNLETLAPASEVILSGALGNYEERDVDSTSVIFPLTVEHVFRGRVSASNVSLALPYHDPPGNDRAASITQGIVNRHFLERHLKDLLQGRRTNLRVLVLGRVLPSGAIAPLSYGCLEIDDEGFVRGPAYGIASGELARFPRSLNDLKGILQ